MNFENGGYELQQQTRFECLIHRTHKRFFLKALSFTQQYAPMYRCRIEFQYVATLASIQEVVRADPKLHNDGGAQASTQVVRRVLELVPGVPSFCVGVVYKHMKRLPGFLNEYLRELVRIDAGDDESGSDNEGATEPSINAFDSDGGERGQDTTTASDGQMHAAVDEHYNVCCSSDELSLEDSSGRVTLQGLRAEKFCTGLVLGIYGTLQQNGMLQVHRYVFAPIRDRYVPRPVHSTERPPPCYLAIVCGLDISLLPPSQADDTVQASAFVRARALLELLIDFIQGNVVDADMLNQSRHISRLVIGGNSIVATEELRLKKKVKLDPSDHVRLNDNKAPAGGAVTSAQLMREADGVIARLCRSVEVELMPGENDMSDAFQPQQPLHPLLLPNAARYSSLRLVTNPFEFVLFPVQQRGSGAPQEELTAQKNTEEGSAGVKVFITCGQNVNDVARETQFNSRLETMAMILASGCACPTAPNTLFSYPFSNEDPFLFKEIPHCFVACDQPRFETQFLSLSELEHESASFYAALPPMVSVSDTAAGNEETAIPHLKRVKREQDDKYTGVRLICVPSFSRTGTLVLVDVNSPFLDTTKVDFLHR